MGAGDHQSCATNLLCERLPAKMPSIDLDLETHQCVPLLSVLQWNPLLTRLFTKKLQSYSPIINSTILVLIDDSMDSGALTAIAQRASTAVRAITASLDGVRTTGIASWKESDSTINIYPFVFETTHYNPREYEREETRFETLVLNLSGGNVHAFIASLEYEIVDLRLQPTRPTSTVVVRPERPQMSAALALSTPTSARTATSASARHLLAVIAATSIRTHRAAQNRPRPAPSLTSDRP